MAPFKWPKTAAESAKLYIPTSLEPYRKGEPGKCFFRFDSDRKLLLLVSEGSEEILDVIDPADVIGAVVEIEFTGSSTNPRSVTNKSTFQSNPEGSSSPAGGGIFKSSVDDDTEKIFSVCGNEPASKIPNDTQAIAMLTLYVYPQVDRSKESIFNRCGMGPKSKIDLDDLKPTDISKLGPRAAKHRKFQLVPLEDISAISEVVRAIRKLCRPNPKSERLLVIVNPHSGTGMGENVYTKYVAPMLDQAGIEHDHLVTTHAHHAEERAKENPTGCTDLAEYDGVVAIGGDGMVHEIFQGIHGRKDCKELLKRLKLGHIGAGTSNGLSKSLAHASEEHHTAIDYTFMVAKGKTSAMDISRYESRSSTYLSFLTFSWSIIADIDIESEAIRFMGFLRMDIWAVWRVLNLRTYKAKFSYLPPSEENVTLPPLSEPIPSDGGWVTSEDTFILFWASHVTHAAEGTFHAPQCRLDDGVFTVFIVRDNISRLRLALILLALEHGGHVDMVGAEFIQCKAYRLEPITEGSFNDLDGEVVESGPIQAKVLPGVVQAYCNL